MGQTTRRSQGSKDSSIQELGPHLEAVLCRQAHARNENDLRHYVRSGFIPPFLVSLPFGCLFFFFLCFFFGYKIALLLLHVDCKRFQCWKHKACDDVRNDARRTFCTLKWQAEEMLSSTPASPPHHCGQRQPHKTIKSSGKCRGWVATTHPAHPAPWGQANWQQLPAAPSPSAPSGPLASAATPPVVVWPSHLDKKIQVYEA